MGRRKTNLKKKRQHKKEKAAMAALAYHVRLGIKEYFKMKKQSDMYLQRLISATSKRDPLPMAVITYQAFRDSNIAMALKDIGIKENYNIAAWDAIVSMTVILKKLEWETDDIQEFLKKSRELAEIK